MSREPRFRKFALIHVIENHGYDGKKQDVTLYPMLINTLLGNMMLFDTFEQAREKKRILHGYIPGLQDDRNLRIVPIEIYAKDEHYEIDIPAI